MKQHKQTAISDSLIHQLLATQSDTVILKFDFDTLTYSRTALDSILRSFPYLTTVNMDDPETCYQLSMEQLRATTPATRELYSRYNSLLGQDEFYMLYSWIIRSNNAKYLPQIDTLENCYLLLNSIHHTLNGFGTFFSHQYRRIPAYAAYEGKSGYFLADEFGAADLEQEKANLLSLWQLEATNNIRTNNNFLPQTKKTETIQSIQHYLRELNKLITNRFVLRRVAAFRYRYYL